MSSNYADIEALRDQWDELFGEPVPMGWQIGPAQVPILRECIKKKSQKPLEDYIDSIPKDRDY